MTEQYTLLNQEFVYPGVTVCAQGVSVCVSLHGQNSNGLLLWKKASKEPVRIDLPDSTRHGNVYQCILSGIDTADTYYMLHEDGVPVPDLQAKKIVGHRLFGKEHFNHLEQDQITGYGFVQAYDWQDDVRPKHLYKDSILYGMHVRGFTKDSSAKIDERGTFAGMKQKIPYLKDLGITAVVLQPVMETMECVADVRERYKINYWGYQKGYYYAPKNAYAYTDDAPTEFRDLVKALHKEKIEVILQFCFPTQLNQADMGQILLYWKEVYHVDGFWLLGPDIPWRGICNNEFLADVKIFGDGIPYHGMDDQKEQTNTYLCSCKRDYQTAVRKFLKGDFDSLISFISAQRGGSLHYANLHFLTSYDGFRLMDLVSYDGKHNFDNGEENHDGEEINHSWNCGLEGETRKKSILSLRYKQMKNAWLYLMTTLGTPMFFMGDECGRSQKGNNNPYCQDNEVNYFQWNLKKSDQDLLSFVKEMIAFRKESGIFSRAEMYKGMDSISCGCPDLSYHSGQAWQIDRTSLSVGMLYCGDYLSSAKYPHSDYYILCNTNWENAKLALPKPNKNRSWKIFISSEVKSPAISEDGQFVTVPGRTAVIFQSVAD